MDFQLLGCIILKPSTLSDSILQQLFEIIFCPIHQPYITCLIAHPFLLLVCLVSFVKFVSIWKGSSQKLIIHFVYLLPIYSLSYLALPILHWGLSKLRQVLPRKNPHILWCYPFLSTYQWSFVIAIAHAHQFGYSCTYALNIYLACTYHVLKKGLPVAYSTFQQKKEEKKKKIIVKIIKKKKSR